MGSAIGVATKTAGTYMQLGTEYAGLISEDQENRRQAEQAAIDARDRGRKEVALYRIRATQATEKARVQYANSGVDSTVGTPANALADSRMMTELDAQTLANNAYREAMGYENQAKKARRQQKQHARELQDKQTATILGGLGDFAGSAGSMSGMGSAFGGG